MTFLAVPSFISFKLILEQRKNNKKTTPDLSSVVERQRGCFLITVLQTDGVTGDIAQPGIGRFIRQICRGKHRQ